MVKNNNFIPEYFKQVRIGVYAVKTPICRVLLYMTHGSDCSLVVDGPNPVRIDLNIKRDIKIIRGIVDELFLLKSSL